MGSPPLLQTAIWRSFLVPTQLQNRRFITRQHGGIVFRCFASSVTGRCDGHRPPFRTAAVAAMPRYCYCFSSNKRTHDASFSTNSKSNNTATSKDSNHEHDDDAIVLYERAEDRLMRPRAAFIVSSFVVTYWSWYLWDFVPHMTSVGLQSNVTFGIVGLGTGMAMLLGSTLYPRLLIYKLEYVPSTRPPATLRVYAHHAFPWPRPSKSPTEFAIGQLSLDPSAFDTKRILNDLQGDISQFEGHLMVKVVPPSTSSTATRSIPTLQKWLPFYLLDISEPIEVKSGFTRLLQAILPVDSKTTSLSTRSPSQSSLGSKPKTTLSSSPPPPKRKR